MPRITPVHYKKLAKFFELFGFHLDRQKGGHLVCVKKGVARPVVILMYRDVPVFIIKNNLDPAGVSRGAYLDALAGIY